MKHYNFLKIFLFGILLSFTIASCSDSKENDHDWGYVIEKDVQETLDRLNSNVQSVQSLIVAHNVGDKVTEVEKKENSTVLNFASGTTGELYVGSINKDVPSLGVALEDDVYYWTVWLGDNEQWLENNGNKIPVFSTPASRLAYKTEAKPLAFPTFGITDDGYWSIDAGNGAKEFLDIDGNTVKAKADKNINLFTSIDLSNAQLVSVELLSGTALTFERTDVSFYIEQAEDGLPRFFEYGKSVEIPFVFENVLEIKPADIPTGWKVEVDEVNKLLKVTAPTGNEDSFITEAVLKLTGKDKNNIEFVAESNAYTLNFTHPNGTFIVMEGNMTSENGGLAYFDQYMRHYENVYETANEGEEHGNVLQDIFIANNKIYLLSQNGPQTGGGDRFIVCDGRTLKKEFSHSMAFVSKDGVATWPQHLVVVDDKAYIQYSTSDMESSSGIRVFDINAKKIAAKDIEGTYGAFTEDGALKGRMTLSRGKIYAGLGNGVVIIDPATDKVTKTVTFSSQVKGLVKGADNNIHIAVAGDFTGSSYSPVFTSNPKIVGIDHDGKQLYETILSDDVKFPVAPWSPSINMGASFTRDHIYLVADDDFSVYTASRFNYSTKTLEKDVVKVPSGSTLYGYMGVHPTSETLFVGTSVMYITSEVYQFEVGLDNKISEKGSTKYRMASPAGMDFGYRFTADFINR